MRKGELLSLKWADIDFSGRTATLHTSKNGKGRKVPLSSRAVEVLQGLPCAIDGKVIPATTNAVNLAWQRMRSRARRDYLSECASTGVIDAGSFEDLRFHDLRHEGASRLAERVPNVVELAAITGHRDLNMLGRYYHPRAENIAKKIG